MYETASMLWIGESLERYQLQRIVLGWHLFSSYSTCSVHVLAGIILICTSNFNYKVVKLAGYITKSVYLHLTRARVLQYLEDKCVIGPNTHLPICGKVIQKACSLNKNRDICISKLICNQLPTLQVLIQHKYKIDNKCPFCKTHVEDETHLFCYGHPVRTELWEELLIKLASWMQAHYWPSSTPYAYHYGVLMVWGTMYPQTTPEYRPSSQEALIEQTLIGWETFLKCFITATTVSIQVDYFTLIGSAAL